MTTNTVTMSLIDYESLIGKIEELKKEKHDIVNSFAIQSKEEFVFLNDNKFFTLKEKKVICFKEKGDLILTINKIVKNQEKLEKENLDLKKENIELKKRKWYHFLFK